MSKNRASSDFTKAMLLMSVFNVLSEEEQDAYTKANGDIEIEVNEEDFIKDLNTHEKEGTKVWQKK